MHSQKNQYFCRTDCQEVSFTLYEESYPNSYHFDSSFWSKMEVIIEVKIGSYVLRTGRLSRHLQSIVQHRVLYFQMAMPA